MASAFITADYDEPKPDTFRAFVVAIGDEKEEFQDYMRALEYAHENAYDVFQSSSIDNYFQDVQRKSRLN